MTHPTPLEVIGLTTDVFDKLINQAAKAHELSAITMQTSQRLADAMSEAIREHEDAAKANDAMNRTATADAHRTMAQRLAAAGAFISSGRLEIL